MSTHYQFQTFEATYAFLNGIKRIELVYNFLQNLFKHIFKLFHYKKQANDLDDFQYIIYNMFGVYSARPATPEDVIIGPKAEYSWIAGTPPRRRFWSSSNI